MTLMPAYSYGFEFPLFLSPLGLRMDMLLEHLHCFVAVIRYFYVCVAR